LAPRDLMSWRLVRSRRRPVAVESAMSHFHATDCCRHRGEDCGISTTQKVQAASSWSCGTAVVGEQSDGQADDSDRAQSDRGCPGGTGARGQADLPVRNPEPYAA
jgi:hypothetical protein